MILNRQEAGLDGQFLLNLDDLFLAYNILSYMKTSYVSTKVFDKQEITQYAGA